MSKFPRYKRYASAMTLGVLLVSIYSINNATMKGPEEEFTTNVDVKNKTINGASNATGSESISFIHNFLDGGSDWLANNLNIFGLYQNLAAPSSRSVALRSGMRKEEVAAVLKKELGWSDKDRQLFLAMDKHLDNKNMEGRYSPGAYLLPKGTSPDKAYRVIAARFKEEVDSRYSTSTREAVDIDLALKIASIIEREAASPRDMNLISGIIWNRIFQDMNLEMDATLQYAKGNSRNGWWPRVTPKDKYIRSPYNTYLNPGLPPTPISNVSIAAIKAALNPKKTKCIFYIHDKRGGIHCSVTYKEHLANIKKYYKK